MPQYINTNISSLNTQRALNTSQSALQTSLQRLSSGLRINSAKDDAAGLSIANRMTSQIRGINQAIRNANDGVSLAQTAEGALAESTNILQRIRELAVQSANATNSAGDRQSLQSEVNQLKTELSRIATTTSFNGLSILDGTYQNQVYQVGAESGSANTISVSIAGSSTSDLGNYANIVSNATVNEGTGSTSAAATTLAGVVHTIEAQDVTIGSSAGTATVSIADASSAEAIATVINGVSGTTGVAVTAETTVTLRTLSADGTVSFDIVTGNGSASVSAAVTTGDLSNLAAEINNYTGTTGVTATETGGILTLIESGGKDVGIETFNHSGASSETIQIRGGSDPTDTTLTQGANDSAYVTGEITFSSAEAFSIQSSIANTAGSILNVAADTNVTATLDALSSVDISTSSGATTALDILDQSLAGLSSIRAELGAIQNRFLATIANLASVSENVSAARGRIQDADFAAETAELSRTQILQQAGIAMLSQANAQPQSVLSLLQ
ncbi:MAG: flagellin [Gammaproteobacteria bacterium]|nr:flagellin [Gammaproteobacteria bacterium]